MTGPALVSPAGPCDPAALDRALAFFRDAGMEPRPAKHLNAPGALPYLAGSDRERADDLMDAWRDDSCDWILAVRGGYGSARLLDLLDWAFMRTHPRLFGGYSDMTALQWAMVRMGVGIPAVLPMALRWPELDAESRASALAALAGRADPVPELGWLRAGRVAGLPLPGNLTVAASLAGGPYFPDCAGRVLILEDVNEPLYKLDRCLTQLRLAGAFDRAAGVIFGAFTGCGDAAGVRALLTRFTEEISCPVAFGFPYGHEFPLRSIRFDSPMVFEPGEMQ